MSILTEDMRRVVREQSLGFVATVCPDGTPNLSPKGTLTVWDDDHLVFADINSPRTVQNLRLNPAIELNVVDALARKGYRFKGTGTVLTEGALFEEVLAAYRRRGSTSTIRQIVLVRVERAVAVVSPVYATGATEEEVRRRWAAYYRGLDTNQDDGVVTQDV
jgi:predicted pyridoxine 5'-phosphate oxidase superfamily flavin-nucleotide-binding protein